LPPKALSLLFPDFLSFPLSVRWGPILSHVSAVSWDKYGTVESRSDAPPAVSCSTVRFLCSPGEIQTAEAECRLT
jgi:hypothetical protein